MTEQDEKIGVKYVSITEAVKALRDGKKVTFAEWPEGKKVITDSEGKVVLSEKKLTYLRILATNEASPNMDNDDVINQPFIAKFIYNGGYMPHAYTPTQYELLADMFIIMD